MSDDTTQPPPTDQQVRGEEILKAMAASNGGRLERDPAGRLRLMHDPQPHS